MARARNTHPSEEYLGRSPLNMNSVIKSIGFYGDKFEGRYVKSATNVAYQQVFQKFQGKYVLDIGCHVGFYSFYISNYAFSVMGIDWSRDLIKVANTAKKKLGVKNVEFVCASIFDLDSFFIESHNINAVFMHKTGGDFSSEQRRDLTRLIVKCRILTIVTNISENNASNDMLNDVVSDYYPGYKWKQTKNLLNLVCRYRG